MSTHDNKSSSGTQAQFPSFSEKLKIMEKSAPPTVKPYNMMSDPNLLLLDEPVAGVDVKTRQDVLATLRSLTGDGVAAILTTHDLNGVAAHLPHVVCLKRTVIAAGPPASTLVPDVLLETFGAEMELIEHHGHPIVIDKHPHEPSVDRAGSAHGNPG